MGKLKTKKGVAKRYKFTKNRKLKFFRGGKSHLATCKKSKRIRKLKRSDILQNKTASKYLKRALPYG